VILTLDTVSNYSPRPSERFGRAGSRKERKVSNPPNTGRAGNPVPRLRCTSIAVPMISFYNLSSSFITLEPLCDLCGFVLNYFFFDSSGSGFFGNKFNHKCVNNDNMKLQYLYYARNP
jgi:hypothetical protein